MIRFYLNAFVNKLYYNCNFNAKMIKFGKQVKEIDKVKIFINKKIIETF